MMQQQVVTTQPGPAAAVGVVNQPRSGNWMGIKVTGIAQVVLGALTIILGIVAIAIGTLFAVAGSPLWCGLLFYIVAGILGIVSGQKKSSCTAIGYMVMSIFACLAAVIVVGLSGASIPYDSRYGCSRGYGGYRGYNYGYYNSCSNAGYIAVDVMLVLLGIAEFIVSIVGASLTCGIICNTAPTQTVIHYQGQPQVIVTGQPQGAAYYPAPVPQQQYAYPAQQAAGPPQGQLQQPPQQYEK